MLDVYLPAVYALGHLVRECNWRGDGRMDASYNCLVSVHPHSVWVCELPRR